MKTLLITGVLIASLCVACVPSSTTRQGPPQAKQAAEHPKNRLRPLLALENQAYRDARTALLAFVDVQDEIDDFAPADAKERMFKRAIQGWVDHHAEYDSVLPKLLADEENGRTIDGEGFRGDQMRRPSPPGRIFRTGPNIMLDDPVLSLPRVIELFLFEKDNLEVKTALLPPPAPRWRYGRVLTTTSLVYGIAYGGPTPLVAAQSVFDDSLSLLKEEVFKPIDANGQLSGSIPSLGAIGDEFGLVDVFNLYKVRWTSASPLMLQNSSVDLRWHYRSAWRSIGQRLLSDNLIQESDLDETGLPVPPRPPYSSGY